MKHDSQTRPPRQPSTPSSTRLALLGALLAAGCAGPARSVPTPIPTDPAMSTARPAVPTYTFVSVSTAKPGKLDALAALASRPGERMDAAIEGVIARQVGVDRERNTVIVWVTLDRKETLYDYLATDQGKSDHGEDEDMTAIIETFEMYDLTPYSTRL